MRRTYTVCLSLIALTLAGEARAGDDATAEDRAAIQRCLDEKAAAGEERETCVGVIADACLDKSEDPSTYGMANCSKREYLVWDERLNATYRQMMAELAPDQRRELRNLQRVWIDLSDKKCGFYRVMQPQGSIIIPIASYCAMRETGRQAVFLEMMHEEGDSR
ncbi:MAG TPA: lysozyme inhibitor LprI family protein [Xanthobacteraceae bacterium]|nr:lysozyme inhibitor LprI family protein [Xanthobacteraceae bacterium]